MALIHRASIHPSKRELLDAWLPTRSWYDDRVAGGPSTAYRLDDPAGEVGLEAFLLAVPGSAGEAAVLHVPLTYRSAPLEGAEESLVGTCEHSVLGTRYVYDGCGDPVWVTALASTILTGGHEADELVDIDGELVRRDPTTRVRGTGAAADVDLEPVPVTGRDEGGLTIVTSGALEVVVVRVVGTPVKAPQVLTGHGVGMDGSVLAGVR
jgi:hypothetical protein